jgi:2-polyprenyl-3-methyl-5-hydroxy-6-metoxy-1,4-benzoquinol methylase
MDNGPGTMTDQRTALVDRLVHDTIATFELMGVYLGLRLDLYAHLDGRPATSAELAERAGIDERYGREWLEQQAVAGVLEVDDTEAAPTQRRYALPTAYRDVLLDATHGSFAGPLAFVASIGGLLPRLVEAYRTGAGVPFDAYGTDIRDHIEQLNRPMFEQSLGTEWLPAVPGLHRRLSADPPARVLDIACGAGWSSIAAARAYPGILVHGIDLDDVSIARARANAAAAGVDDRVTFDVQDAASLAAAAPYDAVLIFEALHDLAQPVETLAAVRQVLAPAGSVIIGDEKVAERFTAPGDDIERLMYGFSITHCLPASRFGSGSTATGTVLRPDAVRRFAEQAGFSTTEILPIEHDMWRFYQLRHDIVIVDRGR